MSKRKIYVAPSILSADFSQMTQGLKLIESADMIHCDVMDGMFVPNISFGPKMIADIKPRTALPLDVHLMIERPERYIEQFAKAGADYITIHYEACIDRTADVLAMIKDYGIKCGVVINPKTPYQVLNGIIKLCDMVLLMSVQPGFGGQSFIEPVIDKIQNTRRLIDGLNLDVLLQVDGGINEKYAPICVDAGADVLVAGSYVFGSDNPAKTISWLQSL